MPEREFDAYFTRHSKSPYETYKQLAASENPQQPFDPENQITPDLTPEGHTLAHEQAQAFFAELNPETDLLFFVSSNEARAIETAAIYREVAQEKGFEVSHPDKSRSQISDDVAEGDIRVIESLSPNAENMLMSWVFSPDSQLPPINWEGVDAETQQKWHQARALINSDDKGSWGSNFHAHSQEIQQIFPEIASSADLFSTEFRNLLRLLRFADKKTTEYREGLETETDDTPETEPKRNVKILGFGHEGVMMTALEHYFDEHGIKNCETIHFSVDEDRITADYRGETAEIE